MRKPVFDSTPAVPSHQHQQGHHQEILVNHKQQRLEKNDTIKPRSPLLLPFTASTRVPYCLSHLNSNNGTIKQAPEINPNKGTVQSKPLTQPGQRVPTNNDGYYPSNISFHVPPPTKKIYIRSFPPPNKKEAPGPTRPAYWQGPAGTRASGPGEKAPEVWRLESNQTNPSKRSSQKKEIHQTNQAQTAKNLSNQSNKPKEKKQTNQLPLLAASQMFKGKGPIQSVSPFL